LYTAASEAGIAIEAVAALARDKSLNVAQEYARRADQLRTFEEPGAIDMSKGGRAGRGQGAPGGGLSEDGSRWVSSRPGFLVHVNVLSRLFCGRFLTMLMPTRKAV